MNCFVFPPSHPAVDAYYPVYASLFGWDASLGDVLANYPDRIPSYRGPTFYCEEICHPSDYLPGGSEFCDETYQPGNQDINQDNYRLCLLENASVLPAATEKERNDRRIDFIMHKKQCLSGVSEEYLDQYCSDFIEDTVNIRDIEDLADEYTIDDQPGLWIPDDVFNQCVNHFCKARFEPAWIQDARDACYEWSDALGCLDHLCGPLDQYAGNSYVKQLADYISSPADSIEGFTREDALKSLIQTPEYLHALSKYLGKDTFFALFGSDGYEKVFGNQMTANFKAAAIHFGFELNPEQEKLLPDLLEFKKTRERIASEHTRNLMDSYANTDVLLEFMSHIHRSQNIDDVNKALDYLYSQEQ